MDKGAGTKRKIAFWHGLAFIDLWEVVDDNYELCDKYVFDEICIVFE